MSEYNTPEQNKKISEFKLENFNAIMREQFQLSYYGHINYEASDSMIVLERHTIYKLLVEQKTEEKKAQEEAMKAAEAKRKMGSWRRHR